MTNSSSTQTDLPLKLSGWAVILGASSGFGEAISLELARRGMDIVGVHLDRRSTMPNVERIVGQIQALGQKALFFNQNAADEQKRKEMCDQMAAQMTSQTAGAGSPRVRVLVHSLAFGTLRPFLPTGDGPTDVIGKSHLDMTCDVMAHSLLYWTQDLLSRGLLGQGSRIFAMTSSGSHRVIAQYGAVSAAKSALESHCRQLAFELAPRGIAVNALCAGVTDTPALRKIPGNEKMIAVATERNPAKRLTTPQDVAGAVAVLAHPLAGWISGNVIHVDGGEDIAG
ncbi:MAG TPA: SDR family oxidoreductase [Pseudomonadota bacterium]|jgi:NAD(P)-dependent dehydrogenase (short-subunit alcohol dehydrogenase family)|nr:SDR family oxidoreductase [Pseudomonadota bacterium]HNK45604.1 SDR family oxidoreductase [Pseudomonadota bacterium]HNN51177.1 SDR family oxidoreductase [Pseudomonadota bacterium]